MKGIHVNWTKPFFQRQDLRGYGFLTTRKIKSTTYDQPDYQIFYTILSAIHWKKHNGPIKLYTDSIGLSFMQQFRMAELYDEINIQFLNGYSKSNVNPAQFWTSGKVKCLAHQTKPFAFLDQDMIIREKLPQSLLKSELAITHWEIPRGYYYFNKEKWENEITHIEFPENYNCDDLVPNTSFMVFNNLKLLRKYTEWHKKLVTTNGVSVPEWFWLLSDQGILGYTLREMDVHTNTLTDKIWFSEHNFGKDETRYKGISEPWYYPTNNVDVTKDNISWEHVWIDKIHYGLQPKFKEEQTQRFFEEIIYLGFEQHLHHSRFLKYWNVYNRKNN
jgi:hypothetical protein